MKTPWDLYKEKVAAGEVTPLDLLNKSNYTDSATSDSRFDTCKQCDRLSEHTYQCAECGCFMALKTKLAAAKCPLHKW